MILGVRVSRAVVDPKYCPVPIHLLACLLLTLHCTSLMSTSSIAATFS